MTLGRNQSPARRWPCVQPLDLRLSSLALLARTWIENRPWSSRLLVLAGTRLDAKSVIGRTISLLELLRAVDGQSLQVGGLN